MNDVPLVIKDYTFFVVLLAQIAGMECALLLWNFFALC